MAKKFLTLAASLALVAVIAVADALTGYEIRLAILYLAPVALATWKLGGRAGAVVAGVAVVIWVVSFESSHPYSHLIYLYWEAAVLGASLLITVWLLVRLRAALERSDRRVMTVLEELESAVAVEDPHSGAVLYGNRRFNETFGTAYPFAQRSGELRDARSGRWYLVQSRSLRSPPTTIPACA